MLRNRTAAGAEVIDTAESVEEMQNEVSREASLMLGRLWNAKRVRLKAEGIASLERVRVEVMKTGVNPNEVIEWIDAEIERVKEGK